MTSQIFADPAVQLALRVALATMFAGAAAHKAAAPRAFAATLRNYRLLPDPLCGAAAFALLTTEISLAAALLVAPGSAAPLAAVVLLALYSGAVAVNLARRRRDLDCGCLGPRHRQPISGWLLARNGVAAAAAATLMLPANPRPVGPIDAAAIAAFVAVAAVLWLAANNLLATWPRFAKS